MNSMTLTGDLLVPWSGKGIILTSNEPISLWGGLDPATGEIIDRRHPLSGSLVSERVLAIPFGRGSCSASGVLLEAIYSGTAPAGIVVPRIDPILGLGAILGNELLGIQVPVLLVSEEDRQKLTTGRLAEITTDGQLIVTDAV